MNKLFTTTLLLLFTATMLQSQVQVQWQKCFGGTGDDMGSSIIQTIDGGYAVAGNTRSNDFDVSGNHGINDFLVVKFDSLGNVQWQKCLGGSFLDFAWSIIQTSDGGFITTGTSFSQNGNVTGFIGNYDLWAVKLDAFGNIQWQKCYGGTQRDAAYSMINTFDGAYVFAGMTESNDVDVSGNHGNMDAWVVKTDTLGNIQWQKCLGGTGDEMAFSIIQSSDSGYVVAGYSDSNDGDVSGNHGGKDYWVVKMDSVGNIMWQKCLGGTSDDIAYAIIETSDGSLVVTGTSASDDGDVTENNGDNDIWVVKLNNTGSLIWQKSFGGTLYENARSIIQCNASDLLVAGTTGSNDGDVTGYNGGWRDAWLLKLDSAGNLIWNVCVGGSLADEAYSVIQTTDGGYAFCGLSNSIDNGFGCNHGFTDLLIVKLLNSGTGFYSNNQNQTMALYPNPVSNLLYINLPEHTRKAEVYDISGKLLIQITPQSPVLEINISGLQAGLYFVKLYTGSGVVNTKFVKE